TCQVAEIGKCYPFTLLVEAVINIHSDTECAAAITEIGLPWRQPGLAQCVEMRQGLFNIHLTFEIIQQQHLLPWHQATNKTVEFKCRIGINRQKCRHPDQHITEPATYNSPAAAGKVSGSTIRANVLFHHWVKVRSGIRAHALLLSNSCQVW